PLDGLLPDAVAARGAAGPPASSGDGSIMIVVATDAPLDARLLRRLAGRALLGLGRTGGNMSNGSGDPVVPLAPAAAGRRTQGGEGPGAALGPNDALPPLFEAAAEATEEAVINSLFRAGTMRGHRGTVQGLPRERVLPALGGEGAGGERHAAVAGIWGGWVGSNHRPREYEARALNG